MRYLYTARFLRSLKKLERSVQADVVRAVKLFESGGNARNVKIHKLRGKFKKWHAFSANFTHRIIVRIGEDVTYYLDVGTHDVYK